MTGLEILALPMRSNDADAATIHDYLRSLLHAVWNEAEGFSGKRPFGNGGWDHELEDALVRGEALPGNIVDGYAEATSSKDVDRAITLAIDAM